MVYFFLRKTNKTILFAHPRDCFISHVAPQTYEEVSMLYEHWVTKKVGSYEFADAVTEHLKSRLMFYPNNCEVDAHGITLLRNHQDEV